jgi:hypothetical protein
MQLPMAMGVFAASAALLTGSAGAVAAGQTAPGNDAGTFAHARGSSMAGSASTLVRTSQTSFHAYSAPVRAYTAGTCDIDLSGIADGTRLASVAGCQRTVTLVGGEPSSEWEKLSVPHFWGTWNCPPFVETCTPQVLFGLAQNTTTLDYSGPRIRRGGLELEPDLGQLGPVQVSFFKGHNGTGQLLGTVTRSVNGDSGALLFAARMTPGFSSIVITDLAGDDFAIGQLRVRNSTQLR